MFRRYTMIVKLDELVIYERSFYSLNHCIKFATGFGDDAHIVIEDLVLDKVIPNYEVRKYVREFLSECEVL